MPSEDAKDVKKAKSLSSFVRKKPMNAKNAGSSTTVSRKLKKEDDVKKPIKSSLSRSRSKAVKKVICEEDEKKSVSKRSSSAGVSKDKELKKKKTGKEEEEEEEVKKKREKKVYDLPGQKRDQPEERDSLRIFYETFHKQVPTSEIAQIWMMESGLLPDEEAKKVLEKKLQKSGKLNSPAKSTASNPITSSKSVTTKEVKSSSEAISGKKKGNDLKPTAKKRKKDSDDDLLASRVSKKPKAKWAI